MIQMRVAAIGKDERKPSVCVLLLEEIAQDKRYVAIPIGNFEAKSIAVANMSKENTVPIIYDLTVNMLSQTGYKVERVEVVKKEAGVYLSEISVINTDSKEAKVFQSRTSDAVALALRVDAPIFIKEELLNSENGKIKVAIRHTEDAPLDVLYDEELQEKLQQAIDNEQYNQAVQIQKVLEDRLEALSDFDLKDKLTKAIVNKQSMQAKQIRKILDNRKNNIK